MVPDECADQGLACLFGPRVRVECGQGGAEFVDPGVVLTFPSLDQPVGVEQQQGPFRQREGDLVVWTLTGLEHANQWGGAPLDPVNAAVVMPEDRWKVPGVREQQGDTSLVAAPAAEDRGGDLRHLEALHQPVEPG